MSQLARSEGSGSSTSLRRWQERDRPILAYGLMLFAAVSLVLNYFIKFPTLPDETAASFREYLGKRLSLHIETDEAKILERYLEAGGLFFPLQILDSRMYTLKGGRVHRVLNRKAGWIVYQNAEKHQFVFQVHKGGIEDLPASTEIRWRGDRSYYIYLRRGTTIVFWEEKDLCCALISDADPETAIRLAQASARI
jgi:hypothetical protein